MTKEDIERMRALDEAAEEAGGFVDFLPNRNISYDYRKMLAYCKDKGIEPLDLTIRELNTFVIM